MRKETRVLDDRHAHLTWLNRQVWQFLPEGTGTDITVILEQKHTLRQCIHREWLRQCCDLLRAQVRDISVLSSMDEIAEPVPEMPGEHRDALTSGGGVLGRCHWRLEEVLKARKEVLATVNRENVCKLVDAKVEISLPFFVRLSWNSLRNSELC